MADIYLQKATTKDIPALRSMEKRLNNIKTYSAMTTEKEWKEELAKSGSVVYLIIKDGIIVGNSSYEKKPDGSAYISGVVVDPEFQRQGIGREAIRLILEDLKNTKVIKLVTHPENSSAIKIYLSLGFVIKSWKENYYGDGEPRIEMIKINQ